MRVLIAPDSFKGTLTAAEVAEAMAGGVRRCGNRVEADLCPLADGGEGSLEVLAEALGAVERRDAVAGPCGGEVAAGWAERGGLAIIEVAQAAGLGLVDATPDSAWRASSRGTGELIALALERGARRVLVAAGGSATTDGGRGAVEAIEQAGGTGKARIEVLCDVEAPFELAAEIFAPQKGADRATVERLSARLDAYAEELPRDPRGRPRTGCAGGLSGGLWSAFGAALSPGAATVFEAVGLPERLRSADLVLTGEGTLDGQSLAGKLVGELARWAGNAGVPVHAIVAGDDLPAEADRRPLASVSEAGTPAAIMAAAEAITRSRAVRRAD